MILSTGGSAPGGVPGPGVPAPGGVPGPGGVCSWGALLPEGLVPRGGVPGGDSPNTATAAGDTHPTGMHSCFYLRVAQKTGREIGSSLCPGFKCAFLYPQFSKIVSLVPFLEST